MSNGIITVKYGGLKIPFNLGKFVNENGQDDETLEILSILIVNALRTSASLRKELLTKVLSTEEFKTEVLQIIQEQLGGEQ